MRRSPAIERLGVPAYNRVNGEACCASKTLLGKILYGEFGFKGYVVSDCGAIADINGGHHITDTEAESAALAVNNGCQLNCGDAYLALHALEIVIYAIYEAGK